MEDTEMVHEEVQGRFTHYKPTSLALDKVALLRRAASELAYHIVEYVPAGRERSLSLTNLEETVFWANKAITRYGQDAA